MAEKRENSVLFSLRELRQIEEDRVRSEEDAIRQREEEERSRVAAEERHRRDEIDRVRREAEDAERARRDAGEARRREEELRLEETERRARVDAQARLEEQRLRMEIEARAREASTKKAKILVALTATAFLVVAVTGVFAYRAYKSREEQQSINEQNAIVMNEYRDRFNKAAKDIAEAQATEARLDEENKAAVEQLHAAKDAEAVKRADERIAAIAKAKREAEIRIQEAHDAQARRPVNLKCANPNDPLCGIK